MFNSSRPSKEECEKHKRALEEMHNAHVQQQQQQQAKQGPGDQQPAPSPIDQVIADWQKTLTASASTATASATGGGSPDSPAPSPLFGPNETNKKKKDDKHHPKNKREGDPLICLSVPSDDCAGKTKEEEQQLQEGKLIILDDYDNGKQHKKTHSRHNSATPPAPADSAEAASDLTGLLLPPLRSSSSTPTSATTTPTTPLSPTDSSSTPPAASAPAGVTSPASSSQPQPQPQPQPQQYQQQGKAYGQPSQFIPQQQQQHYGGGYGGGGGSGAGSGPAPGSFHPPAYQNVGPGGAPYGTPIYNGPAYGGGGGYPPQQQQQQQYGFPPGPGQGYPGMYQQPPPQQQQGGPMGYAPQAPLQQQMNAPMGYNQPRPMGLSAPYQGGAAGGAPMGMASPLPASAPEALADQLSNLHVARQNFMQQQPPQHGLMQPLVPVAAPMISSPDNTGASGAAAAGGSGSGSGVDDEWHIEYNELETNKEIARGSFGVVYQGAFRGTEVAVKKLIQQHFSPEQMKDFLDEINMMKKLHHPNVVLLIGVCVKEPNLCIVTELLAGSMWNLLHDKSVRLDWKLQHKLLLDTAKGMNYLHLFKPPIIHRDLKSPNLLVDSHFNVKIADFGLARIKAQLMTGNLGTCQYMAPEVITSATYSEKADVYSYGVVIWEVLTRQAPWQGMQPMQIAYGVVHQSMRPPIPPGTAPPLVHLMQQCWHQDPTQRPSFTEILQQLKALHV